MEPTKSLANKQMCNFDLLKSRFPEISDEVITQTLQEVLILIHINEHGLKLKHLFRYLNRMLDILCFKSK